MFGGTPAVEGDIKYLVFLQITTTTADGRRRDFSGGGTIIRKYWILTAGHNLGAKTIDGTTYRTTRVRIVAGTKDYEDAELNEDAQVKRINVNRENVIYNPRGVDAALIHLTGEELNVGTGTVEAAVLLQRGAHLLVGTEFIVTGWGIQIEWTGRYINGQQEVRFFDSSVARQGIAQLVNPNECDICTNSLSNYQ